MKPKNHYQILGISPTATEAEINRAYELRMQQLAGTGSAQSEAVRKAQAVLSDPVRRGIYDASLRKQEDDVPLAEEATSDTGARMRWLMVLGGLAVLITAAIWWMNRPPVIKSPVAPTETLGTFSGNRAGAAPDQESRNNGLWQQKWSERTDLENRLMHLQREHDIALLEHQRNSRGNDAGESESARRAQEAMNEEIDWLKMRIEVIDRTELLLAKQGTLVPRATYQPR